MGKLKMAKFQSPTNIRAFYQAAGQNNNNNMDVSDSVSQDMGSLVDSQVGNHQNINSQKPNNINLPILEGKMLYKCKQLSSRRKELLQISKVKNSISSGSKNKDWRLTNLILKN